MGMVDSGVFIVRLKTMDDRDKAYESNGVLFDNKPFIIKPWKPEMSTDKSSLSTMPVWIQLPKLRMEYWGEKSLRKIARLVGSVIKLDQATSHKIRLQFSRVLVELNTNEEYPEEIHFINVKDELVTQKVTYEWKPILCKKCKKMGYFDQECKTGEKATKPDNRQRKDKEGFQKVV